MVKKVLLLAISMIMLNLFSVSVFAQNTIDINSCSWIDVQAIQADNGLYEKDIEFNNPPDGYFVFSNFQEYVMEGEIASSLKQGIWIYYKNGQIHEKIEYLDGIQNGIYEVYFPTGELQLKCTFVNGQAEGPYIMYDIHGNITMQEFMSNGLIDQD